MQDRTELSISPTLARFAGVAQFLKYCEWQHKIAYENGMDSSASKDFRSGNSYLIRFQEHLSQQDLMKYGPLIDALGKLFSKNINSHERLPGVQAFPQGIELLS